MPYKPIDTVVVGNELYIADGYGANYISSIDLTSREWTGIFGGKTDDPAENGKFATAQGINVNPVHHHLDIMDRPHSWIQNHHSHHSYNHLHGHSHGHSHGHFAGSHKLPAGAFLCGIDYSRPTGYEPTKVSAMLLSPPADRVSLSSCHRVSWHEREWRFAPTS